MAMLNIGYTYPCTEALGPGKRYAIWVRGCNRRCPGCTSPELQERMPETYRDVDELAGDILSTAGIDGVTVSGGEPLLQAEPLGILLRKVKERRPELNVILFTGYSFDRLPPEMKTTCLRDVDLMIDGEYKRELNDGVGLRGSGNQRFHYLSDALKPYAGEIERGRRKREIHLINELETLTIGIAPGRYHGK